MKDLICTDIDCGGKKREREREIERVAEVRRERESTGRRRGIEGKREKRSERV